MNERVLITGASGFLGYHIVHSAIESGLSVFAAVRKQSNIEHLKDLPVTYLFLDYGDEEEIAKQLIENRIDYIIHAAGDTKAITEEAYNNVNATYTVNLAKAAERSGGNFKKMIFISSLAAIGPLQDADVKITEETTPNPVTAYGRSKLLAEKSLAGVAIPITILRPTAIYGPRDRNIFIMVKMVTRGLDPYIGKGSQQLSFVHAADVADVAVKSLFINTTGIYNITDGNSYDRYKLSDIIKSVLKRKAIRIHIPVPVIRSLAFFLETINAWSKKPSVISREKLHELAAKNWVCDISKAKKELAFVPTYNLQTGLEETILWYRQNKWL
ncbi:MAG: NAD-dependent epimerase/dehydratase family protein [Ferruginibacter sp.]